MLTTGPQIRRIFSSPLVGVVVCVFAILSYAIGDRFTAGEFAPWLAFPGLIALFFILSPQVWLRGGFYAVAGLIAAHVTMGLLGFERHGIMTHAGHHSTTAVLHMLFEVGADIALAVGFVMMLKRIAPHTYEGDVIATYDVERVLNWRLAVTLMALPFYVLAVRYIEAVFASALFGMSFEVLPALGADLMGYFIFLPAIVGIVLTLTGAPRLEPDYQPLWIMVVGYIVLTGVLTELGVLFGSQVSAVVLIIPFGVNAILATLFPTMHVAGCLLLVNYAGLITASQYAGLTKRELSVTIIGISVVVVLVMLLRVIAQIKMNRANARVHSVLERSDVFLRAGTGAYIIHNEDFGVEYLSDPMKEMIGIEDGEAVTSVPPNLLGLSQEQTAAMRQQLRDMKSDAIYRDEKIYDFYPLKGSPKKVKIVRRWILDPITQTRFMSATYEDVTRELELEELRLEQEEFLKALNVEGPQYMSVEDEAYKVLMLSEVFAQDYLGLSASEVIGKDVLEIGSLSAEERARIRSARENEDRLLETGALSSQTYTTVWADGCSRTLTTDVKRLVLPNGRNVRVIVSADITHVEEAKKRSEVYLHAGTSLFFIRDEDFELEFVSEPLINLLGYENLEEVPPTKNWRYDAAEVSTAREFMNSKPLGEAFVLPEVTDIRTKDGRKLSFVETFKWFEDPITDRRMLMTSYENVTDLIAEKDKIETLRKRSEKILEAGVNAFIVEDDKDNVLYASPAAMALLKFTSMSQFVASEDFYEDLDPEDLSKFRSALARTPEEKIMKWGKRKIRCGDGSIVTVDVSYSWFQDVDENWMLMIGYTDVTELVAEQELTNNLLSSSSALIITQTRNGVVNSVSQAFVDLMGHEREEIIGRNLIDFYHPEDKAEAIETRRKFFNSSAKEITFERRLIDVDNQIKSVMCNLRKSKLDSKYHTVLTLSDITAAKEAEEKLQQLVEIDELTGLFSRRGLNRRFGSDQRYEDLGMYLIDLDHFKSVNDGYGHDAGDKLLKATANALKSQTRTDGSCFRLGGEEFAVLRPWRGWKDAYDFAENLREQIGATSIDSDGRNVQRTASIGVSYLPVSGSMSEALKLGDMVLLEAKALGRNRSILADESMLETLRSRGMFIQASEVQLALERGELEYFVQSIVNGPDTNIVGFEAVIRWFLPSGELIEPKKFVDLLYQVIRQPRYAQLQLELRRKVLEKLKDYPESYVSFNLTLEQIGYFGGARALHRDIQSILDHADRQIVIELCEKALHARVNEEVLIEELSQLRGYGYKIALDDFGVEASNIQRLQHYPIDIVKLDRSLIMDIETSAKARKMVDSLAVFLTSLELDVIVEGIETKEQAEVLNLLGLTVHQGYLYSKPTPPEQLGVQAAE